VGWIHQVLQYLLDADSAMMEWNFDDWVGSNCNVAVLVPMRDDVFVERMCKRLEAGIPGKR